MKKYASIFLAVVLIFLSVPMNTTFASQNETGLLYGKEMDILNSAGTKIATTLDVTDGDLNSKLVLESRKSLSYKFSDPKTITSYSLNSEINVKENRNRLKFEFYDSSNKLLNYFTIPSFTGHKTYLENPVKDVNKVIIRNISPNNSTNVYDVDLFETPNTKPTYLDGLLDKKPLVIGAKLGETLNLTDGDVSTLYNVEDQNRQKSQVSYTFDELQKIGAYQVKAELSTDPYFDEAALVLEFYDIENKVLKSISFPNWSGQRIVLGNPIENVKKVVLKSGTYIAGTPVKEFNVFDLEAEVPKPDPNPDPDPNPGLDGERALLTITMTTGLEKEYDLSIAEVSSFIAWYEAKQAGTGTASYAINKHNNNIGPFVSRKDYVIFDKILTFEVSEYNSTN